MIPGRFKFRDILWVSREGQQIDQSSQGNMLSNTVPQVSHGNNYFLRFVGVTDGSCLISRHIMVTVVVGVINTANIIIYRRVQPPRPPSTRPRFTTGSRPLVKLARAATPLSTTKFGEGSLGGRA